MKNIVIAIDGFSSCGKSTLAKQLAKALQYVYIDSGAMYRAVTLHFLRQHINLADKEAVELALKQIQLEFRLVGEQQHLFLNGLDVEVDIRSLAVANSVSEVSTLEPVRTWAVALQQSFGIAKGIVMDGRDIGSTVFPNAELKLFMTASIEVRTKRRYAEMNRSDISLEEVRKNLEHRDFIDSTRSISPLTQAADAIVIDNTNLDMQQQFELALSYAHARIRH